MHTGKNIRGLLLAATVLTTAGVSCRRPLYVTGDEYHSVVLHTDWRAYQNNDPDGMTAWFFPEDESATSYRITTADVRRAELYLPAGNYTGVIIDYSPDEYGRQEFVGMDYAKTALVRATEAGYQPDSLAQLYGPAAFHLPLEPVREATGLYQVANQPEQMAADTLQHMYVEGGRYGYYIPYEERDTYQSTLVVQEFHAYPISPIWHMRIRIFVKGIDYLYQTEGSIAGLSDGRYLALNRTTDTPCLLSLQEWETQRTGDNLGYIATTLTTFGLLGSQRPLNATTKADDGAPMQRLDWENTRTLTPQDLRLNLKLLLRDRATVRYYHFDVGEYVVSFDDELVLRIDLDEDFPGFPDLPYVEPYNSAGFDAEVTPWADGGSADVSM